MQDSGAGDLLTAEPARFHFISKTFVSIPTDHQNTITKSSVKDPDGHYQASESTLVTSCDKGVFSVIIISQLRRPIEFQFSQVCYFMQKLRYTKWEDWSLTINNSVQCL